MNSKIKTFETLDPKTEDEWQKLNSIGHQMIDQMIDFLKTVRERPVWQPIPEETKQFFNSDIPKKPITPEKTYEEFKKYILPYAMGNIHPKFWGWVIGSGDVMGALSEFLGAIMNPNLGGGEHSAKYVELQVINWFKKAFNFPENASGLLVSGGSMANLIGLTVARNYQSPFDVRKEGVNNQKNILFYASSETHSSVIKASEMLGLGQNNLRIIPVNIDFTININKLKNQLIQDKKDGNVPICIIANVGTVNTGAIDDINSLAEIATDNKCWFHIDSAFGGLAYLSNEYKNLVDGLNKADSFAFDLHKWLHIPYEAGAILIKDKKIHFDSFTLTASYLEHSSRGIAGTEHWFSDYGVELSRGFKSLKVWMNIKTFGIEKYGRMISQNIKLAEYLTEIVENNDDLELLAPTVLQLVNFRFNPGNKTEEELKQINNEIVLQLHEKGLAAPSTTNLFGKFAIRVSITNHRTIDKDLDEFIEDVITIGNNL